MRRTENLQLDTYYVQYITQFTDGWFNLLT